MSEDLNPETGEISPERGNHAIRVTGMGRTHPGIPWRVGHLARNLACRWLGGTSGHLLPHRWLQPSGYPAAELRGQASPFRDELEGRARMAPFCRVASSPMQAAVPVHS